jgi:iron complex outermembrane receptor protein
VIDNWKFTALYSHTEGETIAGPLTVELGVNNISPDRLTGAVQWDFLPNGYAVLGATSYIGRDINEGRVGEEHTHGYTVYDLTVSYDTERWGAFSLGVENLTDKFYFLSFSQIDFFRNYFAGRGRTVSLNYRIDF